MKPNHLFESVRSLRERSQRAKDQARKAEVIFAWSLRRFAVLLGVIGLVAAETAGAVEAAARFSTPEEAVSALSAAVNRRDTNALFAIFGPALERIKSPDPVQARNELTEFAARLNASNHLTRAQNDRCTLDVGQDQWPFPIPLIRANGSWFFDTADGMQEILKRRIGEDEINALKSLRAAAAAQREYAAADHTGDEVLEYAQKFISTPGKKDGLYWPPEDGDISPLGPAFADAQSQGYDFQHSTGRPAPQPFHGYFFKVLTRQGNHAPGGKYDYIINGHMIGGFAFVAWPAKYADTGIMTLIINQQGKVYQKDLGPETESLLQKMDTYDPGPGWVVSTD